MRENNTSDIDSVRQLGALVRELGGIAECRRLGFVYVDEQGVMSLFAAGLGYLLTVKARGITSLAEAFAAGRESALDEIGHGTDNDD